MTATSTVQKEKKSKSKSKEIKSYETRMIPVKDVNLNDWNPMFVPSDMKDAIKDDILQNGFMGSIILQKYNDRLKKKNVIINGEHRFNIFKELGGKEVPATVVDVDEATAQVLTIRLNREHGELLPNRVGNVLNMIAEKKKTTMEFLEKLTFIRQKDLEALMTLRSNDIANVLTERKSVSFNAKNKEAICPSCGHKFIVS
jgi:hypothetical protein